MAEPVEPFRDRLIAALALAFYVPSCLSLNESLHLSWDVCAVG